VSAPRTVFLSAPIAVVGYVAEAAPLVSVRAPRTEGTDAGFLAVPETSADVQRLYDQDIDEVGYVMNVSKLWAHQPVTQKGALRVDRADGAGRFAHVSTAGRPRHRVRRRWAAGLR
jgi:hypothetical protein